MPGSDLRRDHQIIVAQAFDSVPEFGGFFKLQIFGGAILFFEISRSQANTTS